MGASGYIGWRKIPHLHFDVVFAACGDDFFSALCVTVPVTFRNPRPHAWLARRRNPSARPP